MNDMKINYEKLEQAIAGDYRALGTSFSWHETPQGYDYWWKQRHSQKPLDIEALKAMRKKPSIQVGETYTDESGTERECIFIEGNQAFMRRKCSYTAYVWDVNSGIPISPGIIPRINLTPKPVVESKTGTVTFTDGVADFSTWKEVYE